MPRKKKVTQNLDVEDLGRFVPTDTFEFEKDGMTVAVYLPGQQYRVTSVNKDFITKKHQEGKVQWL